MESITIDNMKIWFDEKERETAVLISGVCEESLRLAKDDWGLSSPRHCDIYVMTSWPGFILRSATWPWRILLAATLPTWFIRIRRTWPYAAAWTQRYGQRVAIGVKPPHLLKESDRSIGNRIYEPETDTNMIIRNATCHELVHACSAHLQLPMWLNEGIAIATAEWSLEKPVVKQDTLKIIRDYLPKTEPPTYRQMSRMNREAITYQTIRGYWLVKYIEAVYPGLLSSLFSQRRSLKHVEQQISAEMKIDINEFWSKIDGLIVGYFEKKSPDV